MGATVEYLNQWVNYGGVWTRVGDVYADLNRIGDTKGIWMAGYSRHGEFLTDAQLEARHAEDFTAMREP